MYLIKKISNYAGKCSRYSQYILSEFLCDILLSKMHKLFFDGAYYVGKNIEHFARIYYKKGRIFNVNCPLSNSMNRLSHCIHYVRVVHGTERIL